jgi:hypothetical protein
MHVLPPVPIDLGRHINIKKDKTPAGTVPPRIWTPPQFSSFLLRGRSNGVNGIDSLREA